MKFYFLILLFSVFCLSSCKVTLAPEKIDLSAPNPDACKKLTKEKIFDPNGHQTDYQTLLRISAQADYILIGEAHSNARHHQIQADILSHTGARTVLFEMLEPAHNEVINAFAKGKLSSAQLQTGLRWRQRGWTIWNSYYAIFLAARDHNTLISHASLDNDLIDNVNKFGVLALPRRLRQELKLKPGEEYVVDFNQVRSEVKRSHSIDDGTATRLALSQYVKDAYMAYRLATSKPRVVLISGRGHNRKDIGVPAHLKQYQPNAKVISIGLLERSEANIDLKMYLKQYDYVLITAPQCALH